MNLFLLSNCPPTPPTLPWNPCPSLQIALVLIDEVHLLGESERGGSLEAGVSRGEAGTREEGRSSALWVQLKDRK